MLSNKQIDIQNYKEIKEIGQGSYAKVYLAEEKSTHKKFAIKVATKKCVEPKEKIRIMNEAYIYSKIDYPTVLHFYGFDLKNFKLKPRPAFITDYIPNKSLQKMLILNKRSIIPNGWTITSKYIVLLGTAFALNYLHSKRNIVHRDIKPANILLNEKYYPIICDFGLSKITCEQLYEYLMSTQCGSPFYMAPEILTDDSYTHKIDIYSFSLIIYQIITNKIPPFKFSISNIPDPENKEFLSKCHSEDPLERPNFYDICCYVVKKKFVNIFEDINVDDIISFFQFVNEKENDADSLFFFGLFLFENTKNMRESLIYFEKAAEAGNADAMYKCAQMLDKGNSDIKVDKKKAIFYYEKAGDKGNSDAMYNVAYMLHNGDGVEMNKMVALLYLQKAAEMKNQKAISILDQLDDEYYMSINEIGIVDNELYPNISRIDENSVNDDNAEKSVDNMIAEKPANDDKAEKPANDSKDEKPVNDMKAEKPANDDKAEKPANDSKDEKSVNDNKAEKPANDMKAEKSVNDMKAEKPVNDSKAEKSVNDMKAVKPVNDSKAEKPVNDMKAVKPVNDSKAEKPVNDMKAVKPVNDSKAEKPVNDMKAEKPFNDDNAEKPVHNMKAEKPVNDMKAERPVNDDNAEKPVNDIKSEKPIKDIKVERPANDMKAEKSVKDMETERQIKDIKSGKPVKDMKAVKPIKNIKSDKPVNDIKAEKPVIKQEFKMNQSPRESGSPVNIQKFKLNPPRKSELKPNIPDNFKKPNIKASKTFDIITKPQVSSSPKNEKESKAYSVIRPINIANSPEPSKPQKRSLTPRLMGKNEENPKRFFKDTYGIVYILNENDLTAEIYSSSIRTQTDIFIQSFFDFQLKHYKITRIADDAFANSTIEKLSFADNSFLSSIGKHPFKNSKLSKFHIPSTLIDLDFSAFQGADNLMTIEVDPNNKKFSVENDLVFYENRFLVFAQRSFSGDLNVPKGIIRIGRYAFAHVKNIRSFIFNNSTQLNIGMLGFYKCENLEKIDIKTEKFVVSQFGFCELNNLNSVKLECKNLIICSKCFQNCTKLSEIAFKNIENAAFNSKIFFGCENLKNFEIVAKSVLFKEDSFHGAINLREVKLMVNDFILSNTFMNCSSLSIFSLKTDKNISINQSTFQECYSLSNLTLFSSSKINVYENAFINNKKLLNVNFECDSIEIHEKSFMNCSSFTSFYLKSNKNITIVDNSFVRCPSLKKFLVISSSSLVISQKFEKCLIEKVCLIGKVVKINDGCFSKCTKLTDFSIKKSGNIFLGQNQFDNCVGLKKIVIESENESKSTTQIGFDLNCFSNAGNLKEIILSGIDVKILYHSQDCIKSVNIHSADNENIISNLI